MRIQKKLLLFRMFIVLCLFLSVNTHEKFIQTAVNRISGNHSFSLFNYHVKYLPNKAWNLITRINSDTNYETFVITNYFTSRESLDENIKKRRLAAEIKLKSIIEYELVNQNLGIRDSETLFPPLFVNLKSPPQLLVVSPRDNIKIIAKRLINPIYDMSEIESLERLIEKETSASVLIVNLGGIATYPPLIADNESLIFTMETIAHEWFHHYWFFKPLGFNYFKSPEMTILNETAAEIVGSEIAKLAYDKLEIKQDSNIINASAKTKFNFNDEMRATRTELDKLLKQNEINKAELYLENRTLAFQESGFNIRKLNQAYFAFYGTYGQNPASSTTITDELQLLRKKSKDLADFINTVSRFGNYNDFLSHITTIR